MPHRSWIRRHVLLPALAAGLCGPVPVGSQPLAGAAPGQPRTAAVRPAPGVEINYGLLAPTDATGGPGRLEGVVSGARGELRTSVLVNPGATDRLARLDTRWQSRMPGPLRTLVVGDTFGSGGGWSRPVHMGGVRLGRSLSLRPGFDAGPQAAVPGSAALPPSPMSLAGGTAGEAGDAMKVLPGPLPAAGGTPVAIPAPLQAGASDYEIEAGRLRTGWGTVDDRYREGYAAAAYRAGLGAKLTAEARAEWTPSRTAAGLEMSRDFGSAGSVRAVLAQSETAQESGLRWGMGLVHNAEGAAWTLSSDGFDRGFTPLGAASGEADPRGRVRAGATLSLWSGARAGVSYARQTTWEAPAADVLGLSAQFMLPERSSLSLNYSQRPGAQPGWQAGLKLSVPLTSIGL